MSILVMSMVWARSKADGSALLCALAIADFADDDGRAFPSVATLAKKTRCSERTVQYALNHLRELGELLIDIGSGPKGCNVYRLQVQNLRGANSAGVQNTTEGGATGCTQTVIEPSEEEVGGERPRGKPKPEGKGDKPQAVEFDYSTGLFRGLTDDHFGRWSRAFPAVNAANEVAKAAAWAHANPANRKSNWLRFLTNWLSRAQDRAPTVGHSGARSYGQPARTVTDERAEWLARATGRTSPPGEPDPPDYIDG